MVGGNVPSNYIPAVKEGFFEAHENGTLAGNPIYGGGFHAVDSSELAFLATIGAFPQGVPQDKACHSPSL